MNTQTRRSGTLKLVQIALLAALVLVIQFFFANARIGIIEMNFCLIPIVIAGIFVGPAAGFTVGAISGIATFFQVLTIGGSFYTLLVNTNVVATAIICFLKASLAGWLSGVTYNAFRRISGSSFFSSVVASAVCPIVNTGIFCLGMLVFFSSALVASPEVGGGKDIFTIVFLVLAGTNFVVEFFSTVIITPILSKALFATKVFRKK